MPEPKLIRDANIGHPGLINNHVGFCPMEASIEISRMMVNIIAIRLAAKNDYERAIKHVMLANDAFANAYLIRDIEFPRQITALGSGAVALRNIAYEYLSAVDKREIPLHLGGKMTAPDRLIGRHPIPLEGEIPDTELLFNEQAVNKLCLVLTDRGGARGYAFNASSFRRFHGQ